MRSLSAIEARWRDAVRELETCVLCGRYGVQWSHSNMLRGMGEKSDPWNSSALDPICHHDIDNGNVLSQLERRELHFRSIVLTHSRLIVAGRLVLR